MTNLLEAIFNCDIGKLKAFIGDGRYINCEIPGTEGCTILHIAAGTKTKSSKDEMISYLLDMGGDPNARSYDDLTPVHIAAMWNNYLELESLLQNGGNPWLLDNEEKNAFDMAADNYAYEAYQLLNLYLADNKFNYKIDKLANKIKSINLTKNKDLCDLNSQYNERNTFFYSANENFPLNFSSSIDSIATMIVHDDDTDDSKSFLMGVSKILNKNRSKTDQKVENVNSHSDFSSTHSWIYINGNNDSLPFQDKKYSYEQNELCNSKTSNSGRIISDNSSGIVLVEEHSFSNPFSLSNEKCHNYNSLVVNDWMSFRSDISSPSSSDCSSFSNSEIIVPTKYAKLSNSSIYKELVDLGDKPGPINDFTREVYLKRLTRLKSGCNLTCSLPEPKYCPEIYRFLNRKLDVEKIQEYVNCMTEEFNNSKTKETWREGRKKCCFNYFLLDPRVTQNLPARQVSLTFEQKFKIFLDAIFYVGKGTKGRPYKHLLIAAKALIDSNDKSDKIKHILDIWKSGYGVISLHCFNNCIPVEAYTQEACIIEALGLKNLTNIRVGDYYGKIAKWTRSRKRQIGISFLYRALQIFLHEGEKQIKPKDLKKKM